MAAKVFSWGFITRYVLTTQPIADLQPFAASAVRDLVVSFANFLIALTRILSYTILLLLKLSVVALPHASKLFRAIYKFHRTQLSWSDIAVESLAITLLVSYIVFRKRILAFWVRVEAYISAKSRAAAAAAPHVLFFTSALFFAVLGRKFLLPFTSSSVMPVFTLLIPAVNTYRFVVPMIAATDKRPFLPTSCQLLTLWVVLGIYHAFVTAVSAIPFSARVLRLLPYLKELIIVVLVWIQLSPVFTDIVYTSVIFPVISRLSNYLPFISFKPSEEHTTQNWRQYFISMLKIMRILQDSQLDFLNKLLEDGVVTIIGAFLLCMPTMVATAGMMLIATLLPAFRVVALTQELRQRGAGQHHSEDIRFPDYMIQQSVFWLQYWLCFAVFWLFRVYVSRPWPSVTIIVMLWLQHTFFQGASRLYRDFFDTLEIVIHRNHQVQMQRSASLDNEQQGQSSPTQIYAEVISIDSDIVGPNFVAPPPAVGSQADSRSVSVGREGDASYAEMLATIASPNRVHAVIEEKEADHTRRNSRELSPDDRDYIRIDGAEAKSEDTPNNIRRRGAKG